MKPATLVLEVLAVDAYDVHLRLYGSVGPAWNEMRLTHNEYVGLAAALLAGAKQSNGLLHLELKDGPWRNRGRRLPQDAGAPPPTPRRANSGSRRGIPVQMGL